VNLSEFSCELVTFSVVNVNIKGKVLF